MALNKYLYTPKVKVSGVFHPALLPISSIDGLQTELDAKQSTISDLSTIRSGATAGSTALQPNDNVSELTNDAGYLTSHQDISGKANVSETGYSLELSMNSSTYVVTAKLKNKAGTELSSQSIDLPLESVVVSGSYDNTTKKVILTLKDGSTVEFSVADLVSGLQTEITSSNKLSVNLVDGLATVATSGDYDDLSNKPTIPDELADLTDDATHRTVTDTEKTTWNSKQDAISDLATIRSGASAGATALQSGDNISELTNDAGYTTNTGTITGITMNGASKGTSGVVDLGTVITEHQSLSGKQDADSKLTSISGISSSATGLIKLTNGVASLDSTTYAQASQLANYQPLDADLTAIAGLTGTSGLLKKTASNTWALDTNTYLTGITSSQVTTALGYTPYNSTNPNGYTSNTGTVTSVQVQAGTGLSSSQSTAQTGTLNTTISVASGYKLPTTTEWSNKLDASKCTYQTTAPTSAISDGGVHLVYLTSEPATKYSGYIYFISES